MRPKARQTRRPAPRSKTWPGGNGRRPLLGRAAADARLPHVRNRRRITRSSASAKGMRGRCVGASWSNASTGLPGSGASLSFFEELLRHQLVNEVELNRRLLRYSRMDPGIVRALGADQMPLRPLRLVQGRK
jgi:hypothetical protein